VAIAEQYKAAYARKTATNTWIVVGAIARRWIVCICSVLPLLNNGA
jgi:hypothetical protein